jgi:hypothetical protein
MISNLIAIWCCLTAVKVSMREIPWNADSAGTILSNLVSVTHHSL